MTFYAEKFWSPYSIIIQCIQRLPILVLIASQTMTTKNKSKFLLFYLTRYRLLLFLFIFIMNSLINYVFNTCNKKKFWRKKNLKYRGFPFDIWTNFKDGPTLTDEVNARKVYFQAVVLEYFFTVPLLYLCVDALQT